jgi:hypothetical protein
MKHLLYILAAFALLAFTACTPTEKKADVPPPPQAAPEAPATAQATPPAQQEAPSSKEIVEKYEKTLVTSMDKARAVQTKMDLDEINMAVRNFQNENGRYPATLDEIKGNVKQGIDLGMYSYDSNTGAVNIK